MGLLRGRGAGRRRAQSRKPHVRRDHGGGRRPRHHRDLDRRPEAKPHTFEWQRGSMFSIPLNTWHRIINAASSPALILVASTAPNVMNIFRDSDWIFNCPVTFPSRFDGSAGFLQAQGRHRARSAARAGAAQARNFIPDIFNAELYLDNRRSPGYTRVEPRHGQQRVLRLRRRAQDRPLFQGARPHVGGGARLPQGQGLHLYVAARDRHDAVEGRQDRQTSTGRITSRSASSPPRPMAATGSTPISASARSRCG